MTKVPLTLSVHIEKKELFEATKSIHGKTLTDYLDQCLDALFLEIAPDKALEIQIQNTKVELVEMENNFSKVSLLMEQVRKTQKKPKKQEEKVTDSGLEKIRLEKFNNNKKSIYKQVTTGYADWKKFADIYLFDTANEAREWIMAKLQEEKLL